MPEAAESAKNVKKPLKPAEPLKRVDALKLKKEALQKQIDALEAKEAQKRRKEDTRKKVIVGAAILANIEKNPETRRGVVEVLNKAVTSPRDREFLKSCGLLS